MTIKAKANSKSNKSLKVAIIIVALSFLIYKIYWTIQNIFWFINLTTNFIPHLSSTQFGGSMATLNIALLAFQEYSSAIGGFIGLIAGITAILSAIQYVKNNPNYIARLRVALIAEAVFFILLAPSSIHHLVGTAYLLPGSNLFVGLSYLLQVLLVVPPLVWLSQKMRHPQNLHSILKGATIAASLFVLALWFKYLFLWIDTLVPLNSQPENPINILGTANSIITLLLAACIFSVGSSRFNRGDKNSKNLFGYGLILVGSFFIIFSLVALFVPIYASFWYLTDTWMLTLPILGLAIKKY